VTPILVPFSAILFVAGGNFANDCDQTKSNNEWRSRFLGQVRNKNHHQSCRRRTCLFPKTRLCAHVQTSKLRMSIGKALARGRTTTTLMACVRFHEIHSSDHISDNGRMSPSLTYLHQFVEINRISWYMRDTCRTICALGAGSIPRM
jgi:hypothetical protein